MKAHYDELLRAIPENHAAGIPYLAASFCDAEKIADARAFFTPRAAALPGGPRGLAEALESAGLCVAQKAAHAKEAEAWFSKQARSAPKRAAR